MTLFIDETAVRTIKDSPIHLRSVMGRGDNDHNDTYVAGLIDGIILALHGGGRHRNRLFRAYYQAIDQLYPLPPKKKQY